jgi:ribosomal protein S18 acetylase RimI-like enzyme
METPYLHMRLNLNRPVGTPAWPEGVCLTPFTAAHAPAVHALLQLAYANGGGRVAPFAQWWQALCVDDEYDSRLCLMACGPGGVVAGVAQCWTSAFVKDLAVHPAWRRRGVATALLLTACHTFRERGAPALDLKVETDNPSGAVLFYRSRGMICVPATG